MTRRLFAGSLAGAAILRSQNARRLVVEEARAQIPKIRMRDVEVQLTDGAGKPLAGMPVEVVQTRQAFHFGDQMWALDQMARYHEEDTDKARYWKLRFTEVLNSATALCYWTERPRTDASKTEDMQGEPRLDAFAYCVDWAASQGLTVKGHPLMWSLPKAVPEWVMRYPYETRLKFAEVRVRDLVARFKNRIRIWDVVNEALWEPSFRNLPDRHWPHLEAIPEIADYVGQVLSWACDEDPDACFVLNDYGLEQDPADGPPVASDGTRVTAELQRTRMLKVLERLAAQGTLPGAIGLQSHPDRNMDPAEQRRVWDQMATSGLPIHITEFGATGQDDQAVADYVADMMTCAFGHPAVEAFFFWGFDGVAWRGDRSAHELKPVFTRIRDLLHKEWMTRASLVSDSGGRIRFRGFLGDYSLRYAKRGVRFRINRQDEMPLHLELRFAG